jgi:hypothetical protein
VILFYLTSVLFYFYSLVKTKQGVFSPFIFYGLFSFIYSFFPWFYLFFESEIIDITWKSYTLENSVKIINLQAFSYFCVGIFMHSPVVKNLNNSFEFKKSLKYANKLFWIFFPISLILSFIYPWHQFGEELTVGHSIAAFFKTFLLILFSAYCDKASILKRTIAFFAFLLLCFIDTSRTTLFIVVFLYGYHSNLKWSQVFKFLPLVLLFFFLFIWITLKRNNIDFEMKQISWVFYVESVFGSYSTFQSISVIDQVNVPIYIVIFPFLDAFVTLVPSFVFDLVGLVKSNSLLMNQYLLGLYDKGFVSEMFAPMGGHFYLAEFYLYFRYLSPLFIIFYFLLYFKLLINLKSKEVSSILFCSSFLLVKAPILNNFKFFLSVIIIYFIISFVLYLLSNVKRAKKLDQSIY